jgi:hypothetical protein
MNPVPAIWRWAVNVLAAVSWMAAHRAVGWATIYSPPSHGGNAGDWLRGAPVVRCSGRIQCRAARPRSSQPDHTGSHSMIG